MEKLIVTIDGRKQELCALGGTINWTCRHYIEDKSVEWKYKTGDALMLKTRIISRRREVIQTAYINGRKTECYEYPFGFSCWIYSENSNGTILKFEFGTDGKERQSFEYTLNFTGWKQIAINYERGYMRGSYDEKMNYFRITALSGAGAVYLEDINFCRSIVPNRVYETMAEQIKNLPLPTKRGPVGALELFSDELNEPVFLLEDEIGDEQKKAFSEITKRYFELIDEIDNPPFKRGSIEFEKAMEVYHAYNITYKDGIVTGKHIKNQVSDTQTYAMAMKTIAVRFSEVGDAYLAECFMDMWKHLMDQNVKISWYFGRGIGSAFLMMKDELIRRGMLENAVAYLKKAYNFRRVYATAGRGLATNARFEDTDAIGLDLPSTLACVLLMEDTPEKVRDMKHLVYYIEEFCLGYAPGTESGYKPDGTGFHHSGLIIPYEKVANYSLARVLYILSDSLFMVNKAAAEHFGDIIRTEFMFQNGTYEPFTLMQYNFDEMKDNSVVEFAHIANALKDREFAQMYVTLAQSSDKEKKIRIIRNSRIRGSNRLKI